MKNVSNHFSQFHLVYEFGKQSYSFRDTEGRKSLKSINPNVSEAQLANQKWHPLCNVKINLIYFWSMKLTNQ